MKSGRPELGKTLTHFNNWLRAIGQLSLSVPCFTSEVMNSGTGFQKDLNLLKEFSKKASLQPVES